MLSPKFRDAFRLLTLLLHHLSALNRFGSFTHLDVCHACNHFCHLTQTFSWKLAETVFYLDSSTVQASSMQHKASYQIWICYSASCAITSKFLHLTE